MKKEIGEQRMLTTAKNKLTDLTGFKVKDGIAAISIYNENDLHVALVYKSDGTVQIDIEQYMLIPEPNKWKLNDTLDYLKKKIKGD